MAVRSVIILVLITWSSQCAAHWTHHLVLDRDNYFHLFWTPKEDRIIFEIQAQTLGFVAIGFSPNGGMKGSDVAMGWVDDMTGEVHLRDMKAFSNSEPLMDPQQNLHLIRGHQNDTHTVITFSRPWDTCDLDSDMQLGADTTRLIWAYHESDDMIYHGSFSRGTRSVYLREMPQSLLNDDEESLKIWDLSSQVELPNNDHTHYWCRIFKAPKLDRKHHMVALRPLIQPGHEAYLHHMVLYECHVPDSREWFDHHAGSAGAACYSPNMPPEWTFCLATNAWAWAVGSDGETLPDHVGMPLGEEYGGATYFMLETHYDNPAMHNNIIDSSGIRIFYTDKVRKFDTAMLLLGSEVNFLHMIPPKQDRYQTIGRCTSDCTKNSLPETGIHILSGVLHSHLSGRAMRLRHVRKGLELPVILEDNSYDFNFQASRQPLKGRGHVMPGDELILECDYETAERSTPTFGGLSTRDEMCLAFILYYPRSVLADCRSLPSLATAMLAFGVQKVYGKAFEKLAAFMQDLEGREESDTLQELLQVLAFDVENEANPEGDAQVQQQPLSEEDLLKKPFYTVERPSTAFSQSELPGQQTNLLPSLAEANEESYREILPNLLLNVKIQSPADLNNVTIGERLAMLDWTEPHIKSHIQNAFLYGDHNSLCLAHGRKPIVQYKETPYPTFKPLEKGVNLQCAKTDHQQKTNSNKGERMKNGGRLIALLLVFTITL